ncbi:sigma-70 family RNA polymerase sigma factor [Pedobacter kyonggii]|uniref:Sigma-70 family RNA polymerase sigma factor n=1 Tax=Pedobacter kyonggii TaxID=1926871 RepID=A0A4Q9H9J4_9SPHI|nr:sigma-70 family RNA polymerase sigma factor [Pedobacter kyonggii]TBO40586.1 sigma-70 family RNA polymerase sigma factor [Pedobacter kyonggii]
MQIKFLLNSTTDPGEALPAMLSISTFELLYGRWNTILHRYAIYYLQDENAAQSIVNDLFLQIWSSPRNVENIKNYLFRSVKNACLNELSLLRRTPLRYLESEELIRASDSVVFSINPQVSSEKLDFLQKVISTLPPRRQLVFRMHRIEGFSYAEIADLLEISTRTVEDHLSKSMSYIHAECKHSIYEKLTEA